MTLSDLARSLGGTIRGREVWAPLPGADPRSRDMIVRVAPDAPHGFMVLSRTPGQDLHALRRYVLERLELRRKSGE